MADRDELVRRLRVPVAHRVIEEDCWYSCPKSGECCDVTRNVDECNCGADAENALRQEAAAALSERAQQPAAMPRSFESMLEEISALEKETDSGWSPDACSHLRRMRVFANMTAAICASPPPAPQQGE